MHPQHRRSRQIHIQSPSYCFVHQAATHIQVFHKQGGFRLRDHNQGLAGTDIDEHRTRFLVVGPAKLSSVAAEQRGRLGIHRDRLQSHIDNGLQKSLQPITVARQQNNFAPQGVAVSHVGSLHIPQLGLLQRIRQLPLGALSDGIVQIHFGGTGHAEVLDKQLTRPQANHRSTTGESPAVQPLAQSIPHRVRRLRAVLPWLGTRQVPPRRVQDRLPILAQLDQLDRALADIDANRAESLSAEADHGLTFYPEGMDDTTSRSELSVHSSGRSPCGSPSRTTPVTGSMVSGRW